MKSNLNIKLSALALSLFTVLIAAGCASTKATDQHQLVTGKITKPAHIWVYNFANTTRELPMDSAFATADVAPQSPETLRTNEIIGTIIATNLVAEIIAAGMPAELFTPGAHIAVNDLVIQGYLLTVDEGSAEKRVLVGFGEGASKLAVAAEGYQMTEAGLHKLGYGTVDASGSKGPGASLGVVGLIATHNPAGLIISTASHLHGEKSGSSTIEGRAKAIAKEIADVLKKRFQQQGWIN